MQLSNSIVKNSTCFRFKNTDLITLNKTDLGLLKDAVFQSELKRFRFCLHSSDDSLIQEMLIGFGKGSIVPVHRHRDKTESFHVVQGLLDVVFFDDSGNETNRINLGGIDSGLPFMYRLSQGVWHTVDIKSDYVVLHEITTGPFNKNDMEILNEI